MNDFHSKIFPPQKDMGDSCEQTEEHKWLQSWIVGNIMKKFHIELDGRLPVVFTRLPWGLGFQ
jgi:hypothetical protein